VKLRRDAARNSPCQRLRNAAKMFDFYFIFQRDAEKEKQM